MRTWPNRHRPLLLAWAAAALLTLQDAALADDPNPYYIGASQSFTHSGNMLRLADGQATPEGFSRSDTISSTSLLAGIDQPFGRQHGYGTLALRANRFSKNDIYNNQGYSLTAGLDWSTAERISGSVKATSDRALASFSADQNGALTKKNVQTTQQLDASVRMGVVTAMSVELTAGGRSVDYSAPEYLTQEYRQGSASLGLRWRPSGVSNFGVALRQTNGRFPNYIPQIDGSFQPDRSNRRDLDLTAGLVPSGASSVDARISYSKTSYEVATQRDFSGVTGLIHWGWQPTAKLRVDTRLSRDPSQSTYFFESDITQDITRLTTALRSDISYQATAKIAVTGGASYARRSLVQTIPGLNGIGDLSGSDHATTFTLGTVWTPSRALQFGCNVSHDRRNSNTTLSTTYSDTTTSCYGQITLQ